MVAATFGRLDETRRSRNACRGPPSRLLPIWPTPRALLGDDRAGSVDQAADRGGGSAHRPREADSASRPRLATAAPAPPHGDGRRRGPRLHLLTNTQPRPERVLRPSQQVALAIARSASTPPRDGAGFPSPRVGRRAERERVETSPTKDPSRHAPLGAPSDGDDDRGRARRARGELRRPSSTDDQHPNAQVARRRRAYPLKVVYGFSAFLERRGSLGPARRRHGRPLPMGRRSDRLQWPPRTRC